MVPITWNVVSQPPIGTNFEIRTVWVRRGLYDLAYRTITPNKIRIGIRINSCARNLCLIFRVKGLLIATNEKQSLHIVFDAEKPWMFDNKPPIGVLIRTSTPTSHAAWCVRERLAQLKERKKHRTDKPTVNEVCVTDTAHTVIITFPRRFLLCCQLCCQAAMGK